MTQKIRPLYDEFGPEGYYQAFGGEYENPHLPQIQALLQRNYHRLDCSGMVLDFAAGGGEVASTLQELGAQNLLGCDPFTHALFEKKTGVSCLKLDFKDVIRAGIPGQYSLIVSSFALHLCPLKDLFSLTWNLLQAAPLLLVITPHKRPELEKIPGVMLAWEDAALTERGKKVRMKAYQRVSSFV